MAIPLEDIEKVSSPAVGTTVYAPGAEAQTAATWNSLAIVFIVSFKPDSGIVLIILRLTHLF